MYILNNMNGDNIITIKGDNSFCTESAFDSLMSKTESLLNNKAQKNPTLFRKISSYDLEKISTMIIKEACIDTPFRSDQVKLVSAQSFPDIIVERCFGVEVKSTTSNHWKSTGSSIVESTRNKDVERIYMLFGKLGGIPAEFKCRPYQDCLYDIAVTHSPRYLIDMELSSSETIFAKMGIEYDSLRVSSDAIAKVRAYYRNEAIKKRKKEMPWWLSQGIEETTVGMNVRLWRDLPIVEKNYICAQALILFPEILNPNPDRQKYDNVSLWLCSYKSIVNPHVRDMFSAGGKVNCVNGCRISELPQVIKTLVDLSDVIKKLLRDSEETKMFIRDFQPSLLKGNIYNNWINLLQKTLFQYGYTSLILKWFEEKAVMEMKR